jgi:ribosomal protein S25
MSVKKRYAFMTDRQQDSIIRAMGKDEAITASAVAERLGIEPALASSNLIQLAKEGRVTKRRTGGRNLYTRVW